MEVKSGNTSLAITNKNYLPGLTVDHESLLVRARGEYAANPHWRDMYKLGRFDHNKAALTMLTDTEISNLEVSTIHGTMFSRTPTLSSLKLYRGTKRVENILMGLFADMVDAYGSKVDVRGVRIVVQLIMAEYFHFNLAKIKLAIQMGMAGHFQTFGAWTPTHVLEWLEQFQAELLSQSTQYNDHKWKDTPLISMSPQDQKKQRENINKYCQPIIDMLEKRMAINGESIDGEPDEKIPLTGKVGLKGFCKRWGMDYDATNTKLVEKWTWEFNQTDSKSMDLDNFLAWKFNHFLVQINEPEVDPLLTDVNSVFYS